MTTSPAPKKSGFSTSEKRAPLGVAMLIARLELEGHAVIFDDQYLNPWPIFDTPYFLNKNKIDVVGIYSNTICYQGTLNLLRKIQYWRKNGSWRGRIAVGGPHTSFGAKNIPEYVDNIVIGEGDITFPRIIAGDSIPRIVTGEKVHDMDAIPIPAWRHLIHKNYNWTSNWIDESPVYTLNTSRGCPYSCTFCSVKGIWGKTYRFMSAKRVIEEVKFLIKYYGMKVAYFREDHFTLNKNRLVEFCESILKENIKISWMCESRADSIDNKHTIQLMSKAGCKALYIGVESGSQRILDNLCKNETVDQFKHVFSYAKQYNIKTYASMIYGVPGETIEDINASNALLNEIKPDAIGKNVYVAIPGSPLYEEVKRSKNYDYEDENGIIYPTGYEERVKHYYENYDNFLVVSSALKNKIDTKQSALIPNHPRISVIMPIRNCAAFVTDAITSILSQTYKDYELLIVDDASTDDTLDAAMSIRDPRISISHISNQIGQTAILNELLTEARGEFIARMDGDDISLPHRFETQLKALESNKSLCVVGGSYKFIGLRDGIRTLPTSHDVLKARCYFENPLPHPFVIMRAEFLKNNQIHYDKKMTYAQDYELWMRILHEYKNAYIGNVPYVIGHYRTHPECISTNKNTAQSNYANNIKKRYLLKLGLSENYQHWNIFKLILNDFVSNDKNYIILVKNLLIDFRNANIKNKVYCELPWKISCIEKFKAICIQHLHFGPWVCKELFTHPDFSLLNINNSEMDLLIQKSLARYKAFK